MFAIAARQNDDGRKQLGNLKNDLRRSSMNFVPWLSGRVIVAA